MINNASKKSIKTANSSLPNMSDTLQEWFQNMKFTIVKKVIINFKVEEVEETCDTRGVIQPFTSQQLAIKPVGERTWKWHTLHTEVGPIMETDDMVEYEGLKYRVMSKDDFKSYGYIRYEIVEDYKK